MRFLLALILLLSFSVGATTYTEFYVQTTGANTNSGHTTDDAATFYAAAGNWTNATGTFFKAALNPATGGVTNGAWAAIYLDAYPTNAMYIGLITNADDTADVIQVNLVAYAGVNPADSVGAMSISVGGAWAGFTTATMANGGGFPLNFLGSYATNTASGFPRCNIKGGTTYNIASQITHSIAGQCTFQGYTNTVGDGGMATIDGGAGTSFIMLNITAIDCTFADLIFANNGTGGSAASAVTLANPSASCVFNRVVVHDTQRSGWSLARAATLIECEAYACNKGNAATHAGFLISVSPNFMLRCISHDNTTANTDGIRLTAGVQARLYQCIVDTNGKNGVLCDNSSATFVGCEFYNNAESGITFTTASSSIFYLENCNFVKNGDYGIESSGGALRGGVIANCGFGTGTQTNVNGSIDANLNGLVQTGTLLYAADATPWTDPANGDFRISLTAAKAAGRGKFTQTQASYAGTVGYPDIGAAQSASTNAAAASGGSYTFAQ